MIDKVFKVTYEYVNGDKIRRKAIAITADTAEDARDIANEQLNLGLDAYRIVNVARFT